MAAVIIRRKDVERLGHTLLKDLYEFFNNEYILTNFLRNENRTKKIST